MTQASYKQPPTGSFVSIYGRKVVLNGITKFANSIAKLYLMNDEVIESVEMTALSTYFDGGYVQGCKNLKTIKVPNVEKFAGSQSAIATCLANCPALETIDFSGRTSDTVPQYLPTFGTQTKPVTIKVPSAHLATWQANSEVAALIANGKIILVGAD